MIDKKVLELKAILLVMTIIMDLQIKVLVVQMFILQALKRRNTMILIATLQRSTMTLIVQVQRNMTILTAQVRKDMMIRMRRNTTIHIQRSMMTLTQRSTMILTVQHQRSMTILIVQVQRNTMTLIVQNTIVKNKTNIKANMTISMMTLLSRIRDFVLFGKIFYSSFFQ